jgi:hypothetical protein
MIIGIDQITSKMKNGNREKGATMAPDREEKSGNEVNGRQIRAIAQRTSLTRSILVENLLVVTGIRYPSYNAFPLTFVSLLRSPLLMNWIFC